MDISRRVGWIGVVSLMVVSSSFAGNPGGHWAAFLDWTTTSGSREYAVGDFGVAFVDMAATSGNGLTLRYTSETALRAALSYYSSGLDADPRFSTMPNTINVPIPQALDMDIVQLSVGIDLLPRRRVDIILSPTISYLDFGLFEPTQYAFNARGIMGIDVADLDLRSDIALGLDIGLEFPIGDTGLQLLADAQYVDAEVGGERFGMRMFGFSVGYRF